MELSLKYEPTPLNAPKFAEDIVQSALEISGEELDYSVESLESVERIIEGFRADGISEEEIAGTLFGFGCYVGEVLVRNAGGRWLEAKGSPMEGMAGFFLIVEVQSRLCNPIGKVFKRHTNGIEDSLPYFYTVFTAPPDDDNGGDDDDGDDDDGDNDEILQRILAAAGLPDDDSASPEPADTTATHVRTVHHDGRNIHLVGVIHGSHASTKRVTEQIAAFNPDVVCLDLCAEYNSTEELFWKKLTATETLRGGHALWWLLTFSSHLTMARTFQAMGTSQYDTMRAALDAAKNLPVIRIDRHPHVTVSRMWGAAGFSTRVKLLLHTIFTMVFFEPDPMPAEELRQFHDKAERGQDLDQTQESLASLTPILLDERAHLMAHQIASTQGELLAVVSQALVDKIAEAIDKPVDVEQLTTMHKAGYTRAVLKWLLALAGGWLLWSQGAPGLEARLTLWAAVTGGLCALTTWILGGHVLSILAAAVISPLTALLPVQPAGLIVAKSEARARPADVDDGLALMHGLPEAFTIRSHRLLRPLLLAVLVDMAAIAATIVVIIWLLVRG